MLKVSVMGDGINFELDGVPEHVAPNIMSWAIAGKYGDAQSARITPPAAVVTEPAGDKEPGPADTDGEPP